jgi:Periplasmic copper-binding protein (NosD)
MRKSVTVLLVLLLLLVSHAPTPMPADAVTRTIVVPDDYPTISEAIKNANDGDTIFVKKGTYEEKTLEINKPLKLIGEGAQFTKIDFDPPFHDTPPDALNRTYRLFGPSIKVEANDFELSGFTISIPDSIKAGGIVYISGNRTQITGNNLATLLLVSGSCTNIVNNRFLGGLSVAGSYGNISASDIVVTERFPFSGIIVNGSYFNISANNISGSWFGTGGGDGIHVEGSSCLINCNDVTSDGFRSIFVSGYGNIVVKNSVEGSDMGIAVYGSNNIIYANRITKGGIQPSIFAPKLKPLSGAALVASGNNIFYANYVANNVVGADINPFPDTNLTSTLYHNNFIDNTFQIATVYESFYGSDSFDNGKEGNFWSDYNGTDVDGDGIGDTPYVIDPNRSDRYPLMAPFDVSSVPELLPEWASPLSVCLLSPRNTFYSSANITLDFVVNKQTLWIGYSLDGFDNVTIPGNTSLTELSRGLHNITVYAKDPFENSGSSETAVFYIAEPFPTLSIVFLTVTIVAVFGLGLLFYFKKRKH